MHAQRLCLPFFATLFMATVLMLSQGQAGEVQLAWDPPATNADNTPLQNFAGYRIHWGQASGSYHATKQVGKETTSVTIANLSEGKTYYFAATAFDSAGNESDYSNEVSTTIPFANPDPNDVNLPVQAVTASAWQGTNVPANTRDGDPATRWSAEGDGQWIMYDLGTQMTLNQVAIAWYLGSKRQSFFAIEVSANGTAWTEVYSGASSGQTLNLEPYSFAAVSTQYVRIVGYGNTDNQKSQWNSLTEVEIYGQQDPSGLPKDILPVQAVTASAWQGTNVPANTRDGDPATRWSAEGDRQWIMYDLGTQMTLNQVAIAWYLGSKRQSFFAIEVSANGTTWTEVYSGASSGQTLNLEPYSFAAVSTQYVRIVGYGNTDNQKSQWNSLTEVELYGQ